ncbi:MAG: transposase [Ignavibacteriae bacterium]|nr:transposase [Ignavibacteriota bacterium]MCB9206552.1 transposase [Ignavibacteriales bacterium]MCB9209634.1 transposase [Ignavibacteriales bacterium]
MSGNYFNKYRISSSRLKFWNYSQNGYYFVTICSKNQKKYFGEISNSEIILSDLGKLAQKYWKAIPQHYPFVNLDVFIIMPNHIHGIIIIDKNVETQNFASLQHSEGNKFGPQSQNLGAIIRGFKAAVKKYAVINNIPFSWQPRFYDRIIRNERELFNIRKYIVYNPYKWEDDEYYL